MEGYHWKCRQQLVCGEKVPEVSTIYESALCEYELYYYHCTINESCIDKQSKICSIRL